MEKVKNMQSKTQLKVHLKKTKKIRLDLNKELVNFNNKNDQYTIPIFIPHKGCKNECVFCNQRKISGVEKNINIVQVEEIIKKYLQYFKYRANNKKIEIAFFGGSFTGIPLNEQIEYLKIANKYLNLGFIHSIRLSTRPDYINKKILDNLKKYNVSTIELGVQSMNDEVLKASRRGHTRADVIRASRLIKLWKINLGHQIMIGLPKSSTDSELYTINEIIKLKPVDLRIYPVYVIEQSELYKMYENNEYTPLTMDIAIDRVYNVVKQCQKTNIRIIRLGLQSTDEITSKNCNIKGPVCDNFAEYILARIIKDKIEESVEKDIDIIEVYVPTKYISVTSGPKKINKIYFKQNYNIQLNVKGE